MIKGLVAGVYVTTVFQRQMLEFKEVKLGKAKCRGFFAINRSNDDSVNGNSKCIINTISSINCIRIKINLWK